MIPNLSQTSIETFREKAINDKDEKVFDEASALISVNLIFKFLQLMAYHDLIMPNCIYRTDATATIPCCMNHVPQKKKHIEALNSSENSDGKQSNQSSVGNMSLNSDQSNQAEKF